MRIFPHISPQNFFFKMWQAKGTEIEPRNAFFFLTIFCTFYCIYTEVNEQKSEEIKHFRVLKSKHKHTIF